jgi:hypothetical protein
MNKNDGGEIGESGQISDNSGYIQESTYLPETESRIPETETVDNTIGDGLPGGSAHGVKSSKVKKSFVKDNLAILVFGGIVLVVGGAVGYKKMTQQGSSQIATQAGAEVPKVEQMTSLPPEPSLPELAPSPDKSAAPAVASSAPVSEASSARSIPSDQAAAGGAASMGGRETPITQSAIPKAQTPVAPAAPVATAAPTAVASSGTMGVEAGKAKVDADRALSDKLAATEKKLYEAERELTNMQQRSVSQAVPTATSCEKSPSVKQVSKNLPSPSKRKHSKVKAKPVVKIEEAEGFNVKVIKNGLAWIQNSAGKTMTVREGDVIPDLGRVTKIDDRTMQVIAGSKRVEQK